VKVEFDREVGKDEIEQALRRLKEVVILQRTPKRVLHRRADLVRRRRVIKAELVSYSGREVVVEIEAESGTYIKELISGDEGRTRPSLSELLNVQAKAVELDVLEVLT